MELTKHFDIWFGGIFFMLGTAALGSALALFVLWPRMQRGRLPVWIMSAPLIVGTVFSLVGASFLGYGVWQYQVEQRLLATGVTQRGTVVEVERTSTRVNGQYLWQIRYEYRDAAGQAHQGVSGYLDRQEAQGYRVGEPVYVRYDPETPTTSIWLGRQQTAATDRVRLPAAAVPWPPVQVPPTT